MNRPKISLCMIVKNEERCLERCLESVQGIVDEVIIVDTGSNDRTVEIAEKYTSQIYHFEWTNNFAEARNFALQYATGEYILHLDADEYLGKGKECLLDVLDKEYYFLRIRNELSYGNAEIHQFIRLFRNDPKYRYVGALHEQVDFTKYPELAFGLCDAVIYHDGYLADIVRDKVKNERNMRIIKEEVKKNPNAFNYFNLGVQYSLENQHEKALEYFIKAYNLGQKFSYATRILVFIMKTLSEMKRYNEALSIGEDSALLYSTHADFQYRVGLIYEHLHYDKDAEACFLKCLEIGEENNRFQFNHYEGTASYLAHSKLSELYLRNGDRERAQQHFFSAVKDAPDLYYLVALFVELFPHLKGNDFVDALIKIWPFDGIKRIEQIVLVLYSLRHPGTLDLVKCYNIELPQEVKAWLFTVESNYNESVKLWRNAKDVNEAHFRDLLLLSFINRDTTLLDLYKDSFNFRNKDWRCWLQLITKRKLVDVPQGDDMRHHWKNLCLDLINLNKFEFIEELVNSSNSPMLRYDIANLLYKQGFLEIALEIIVESSQRKENKLIYSLVSGILTELGDNDSALYYANKAYESGRDMETGLKLLNLLISNDKIASAKNIHEELKKIEPKSPWIQALSL